jgi:MFS family permease
MAHAADCERTIPALELGCCFAEHRSRNIHVAYQVNVTEPKESGYRWVILTVNFVFLAFAYASLTTWSVAIPELSKSFSLTPARAQLGSSVLMGGYAIGSFVESLVASRIGLKRTGLFAAILLLAPQFAIPFLGNYDLILLLRFLQGWGMVWFVTTSMTAAWFSLEQRGMASGIVSGAIPLGIGVGGLLTGRLLELAGTWQKSFIEFGVMVAIAALLWALLARDPAAVTSPPSSDALTSSAPPFSPFASLAGWLVALCLFANAWQLIGLDTVLPSYMYSLGYHPAQAGAAILAAGLIGVVSTPLGGIISDRLILRSMEPVKARAYVMAIPGFLVAGAATVLFPFLARSGYVTLMLMAALAGWGVPLTNASIGALPTDMLHSPDRAGKLFGLIILVGISGGVIAPYAITAISASAGWTIAFAVLGIGALVGMMIGLIIPRFGRATPTERPAAE